jgi:hypothetical protein
MVKIRLRTALLFLLILLNIFCRGNSTVNDNTRISGYDLSSPDRILILPAILHEISGLTEIDSTSVACVQDEKGILFIYDVNKNEIKRQYRFAPDGDYEGITRAGKIFYVLRSDGVLFEISDYDSEKLQVLDCPTGVPARNNEGLCYDPLNKRLLIACKDSPYKGSAQKDKRVIFTFDLTNRTLSNEPVFEFDLAGIRKFAMDKGITLPVKSRQKTGMNEPLIKFKISDIGIHPLTGQLFVLSAADALLFIFDRDGTIAHMEKLNPALFNKSEGITFLANGDLLISNEGQNKKPSILRFNYSQ